MEVLRLIGALLVIVVIFYLAWLVPRVVAKRGRIGTFAGRRLRVEEKIPLGKDTQLVLARVDGRVLLLGVTPGGITRLGDLDPLPDEPPAPVSEVRPFADIFREAVSESLPRGRMRDAFDKFTHAKAGDGRQTQTPDRSDR